MHMAATRPSSASGSATDSPTDYVSRDAGRYLLELYWLSLDGSERVATSELSERLGVSPPSVTEMVRKLDGAGAIEYEKHYGAELTAWGEAVGEALAWRYCVTATFFEEVLEFSPDLKTAYRIGYTLPEEGVVKLGEWVGLDCMRACPDLRTSGGCRAEPPASG